MKQVIVSQGKVAVEEIPAPLVESGTVLVKVDHSCVSIGTEMSGIRTSGLPLWKRALREPEKVKNVLKMAATQGLIKTRDQVQGQLAGGQPMGYSAAGIVLAVGEGVDDLTPGDRVGCAGSQCAFHAEIIRVPRNLAVPVPEGLSLAEASTVTLGAIAMQGVRRATPTLGETFVVIGLGILGQLTVQLLKANGCRVIGVDLDRSRVDKASEAGLDASVHPENGNQVEQVVRLNDGIGADGVIITAATPSDAVISTAFGMCRKKGRVVLVGDVGLNLNRADFYEKELDFFISSSYGPGRYDRRYEEEGLDYPVSYVRWTENRNMAEYLRLLAEKRVRVVPLIERTWPIEEAATAYAALQGEGAKPLMVLLSYPQEAISEPVRVVPNPGARPAGEGRVRIAVTGAGGFAKGMHLPNLKELSAKYHIQTICSRTGHAAADLARQFGATCATTDYQQVLADPAVEAVLIATRHHLHVDMVLAALRAGKHVLVEKPLALDRDGLAAIQDFYRESEARSAPILLTGFNRRFSPFAARIKEIVAGRSNPMVLNYRMNAGYIPLGHWVHGKEGGGRNIGEACHIYDLFTFLTQSRVISTTATAIKPQTGYYSARDNFVATLAFADGSVATLTYTALGCGSYPKERMEVYVDGKVLALDDYRNLAVFGAKANGVKLKMQDKGHRAELEAFARAVREDGKWPIPLWEQVQATEISFTIEGMLIGDGNA